VRTLPSFWFPARDRSRRVRVRSAWIEVKQGTLEFLALEVYGAGKDSLYSCTSILIRYFVNRIILSTPDFCFNAINYCLTKKIFGRGLLGCKLSIKSLFKTWLHLWCRMIIQKYYFKKPHLYSAKAWFPSQSSNSTRRR